MESIREYHEERSKEAAHIDRHDADNVSNAGSTAAIVQATAPKENLTKGQKIKQHFQKRWKWHLLASIILLAIFLPITFKVVIPALAQKIIGDEALPLVAGTFKPISANQVSISLNTSLWSPLPVDVDPSPLYMYNQKTTPYSPFLALTLPQQHVNQETPTYLPETTVDILDEAELVAWLGDVFDMQSAPLSVRSDPTVRVSGMPTYPHLDKLIEMPGLNKFAGAAITGMTLMQPPVDGNNLKGTITMPNWGVLAMTLGNLTMNVWSGNVQLGYVSMNDVVLNPGNTTKEFVGFLYIDKLASNLGAILNSQKEAFNRGMVQFNATGNSSTINGVHITYLEKLLSQKKITMDISVITLISNVLSGFMHGGNGSIPDALSNVFGNTTFLNGVVGHWNNTGAAPALSSLLPRNNNNAQRGTDRAKIAWNLVKLGMKLNGAKH